MIVASPGTVAAPTPAKKKPAPFDPADPTAGVPIPGEFVGDAPKTATAPGAPAPWEAPKPQTVTSTIEGAQKPEKAAAPWAAPTAAPSAAPSAAAPATPSAPTAVPDGSGGAIPVPPVPAVDTMPAAGTGPAETLTPWAGTAPILTAAPGAPAPAATLPGTFSADQNLINSQIGPTPSQRALDLQAAQDAALGKITNGPDRFAIARQQYEDFTNQAESDYRRRRIDETNRAAEGGYLGAGRLTNAYGDLEERRNLADLSARRGFLNDALQGTIQDNLNVAGVTRAAANDAYGQDVTGRNETRGERDYQRGLAEQAIMRRIQQQAAEAGLTQQEFENAMRQYQLGNLNDPTGAYEEASRNASQEASGAGADVAALLRAYAARRAPAAAP